MSIERVVNLILSDESNDELVQLPVSVTSNGRLLFPTLVHSSSSLGNKIEHFHDLFTHSEEAALAEALGVFIRFMNREV